MFRGVEGSGLGQTVRIGAGPLGHLVDKGAVDSRHVLNFQEGLFQSLNWREGESTVSTPKVVGSIPA